MAVGVVSEKPFGENAPIQEKEIVCDRQQPCRKAAQTEESRRLSSPLTRIAMSLPQCYCLTIWFPPRYDFHVVRENAIKGGVGKQVATGLEDCAERAEEPLVSPAHASLKPSYYPSALCSWWWGMTHRWRLLYHTQRLILTT